MTFGVMTLISLQLIKLIKYDVSLYWIPLTGSPFVYDILD